MHCSQVICIIWHAINFLCLLEVTYRCHKIVDKEAIELDILDTVNKVQSDLNCVVVLYFGSHLCRCAVLQSYLSTDSKKDTRMILLCQTADETQGSLNHSIPFMSAMLNLRLVEWL